MTQRKTEHSNVSLPMLVAYVEELLPELASEAPAFVSTQMLWVAEDKAALASLQTQLNKASNDIKSKKDHTHLLTLPALDQQQIHKRHELVCFWLPTLSDEMIQHYIPLLMRYRDLYAAHLLIAIDSTIDLRAYGFTPFDIVNKEQTQTVKPSRSLSADVAQHPITLWQFNLYDYKVLPNWLNNKYWANPENWDKGRW
ncbi:DUF6231 family protein [Psychrobacter sp. DM8]|uniref:DUF6231 family protein n=1 Tax=Psychrobacter sp. DM8 TaxID=3440636 RepID=UPI003F4FF82E